MITGVEPTDGDRNTITVVGPVTDERARVLRVLTEHDSRALKRHGTGYSEGGVNFESIALRAAMEDVIAGKDYTNESHSS